MPTMWFAKDGPRPHSQTEPGVEITADEADAVVGARKAIFVGEEAPSINSEQPSHSLKNVVFEVEGDSDVSALLPKAGFYFIRGLSPSEAQRMLDACRRIGLATPTKL
jgi:hypothetical protein